MNKTVLVTGASGGIGSAICKAFADDGYRIAVHYNTNQDAAELLAASLPDAFTVKADLSRSCEIYAMLDNVGSLDVLVNNAGLSLIKLFTETADDEIDKLIDVDLKATMICSKIVAVDMIRHKSGSIINISSMWGQVGASCEVVYSTVKAALHGFTKALAKELGPSGIRVNCIAPGFIDTKMNASLDVSVIRSIIEETPLCEIGQPSDIAEVAAFLASEKARFITGQIIAVNGGLVV